ncbi:MAG: (2Fe-2S) ferredoxin domain-containing protein [Tepidisphaeraceae bacterium]|jgi:NADP-reducing hydrogenase subunit HndB
MPKLKNVEELVAFRDQKRRSMKVVSATGTHVFVGMGTCGIAAGAKETMNAIKDELARRHLDATVSPVGCIGICVKEPLVDIQQAGQPRVTYANVQPDMVPRLIEQHLVQGKPIKEWAVGRLPTE